MEADASWGQAGWAGRHKPREFYATFAGRAASVGMKATLPRALERVLRRRPHRDLGLVLAPYTRSPR